jgi:phosphoserine phosphatase
MELVKVQERGMLLIGVDNILMEGSLLQYLGDVTGRGDEMAELLAATPNDPDKRAIGAGQVLRGVHKQELEQAAMRLPLHDGIVEAMVELRRNGFTTGIFCCGYQLVADILRRRVFASVSLSNLLNFRAGQATGQVRLALRDDEGLGCARHLACSGAMAESLLRSIGVSHDKLIG